MNEMDLKRGQEMLKAMYERWSGEACLTCEQMGANGSNRVYYRMKSEKYRCIGAYNEDRRENRAFCYYSEEFMKMGIRVPEVYMVGENWEIYLQEDLGDETLYMRLQEHKDFGEEMMQKYREVLSDLVRIQIGGRELDFRYAYPRGDFDEQSMQWDLNYFKYYFLKTSGVGFDEQLLEDDFKTLMGYLLEADCGYFMYRDFQARNIMLKGDKPYYIDYQGGRRGAAQYDVASLLYSAKSEIPDEKREVLLKYYISVLGREREIDAECFEEQYYGYVLIRILQAMGAYGYRGYFEKKEYFLQSIPLAKRNLKNLLNKHPLPIEIPHLIETLIKLTEEI